MSKTIAIIPARMASSRFPGKPLVKILGLPMIEHVRRRIMLCENLDVIVATCDVEIKEAVEGFGGKVAMTSDKHLRCTDRIEEAALGLTGDVIVNIQGDEPVIMPKAVTDVVAPLVKDASAQCSCLLYPIVDNSELTNRNFVKAVISRTNAVLYFSRSPIPFLRDSDDVQFYKQSGIMAYKKEFLHRYAKMPSTPLERAESVDMLRILENDYKILGIPTADESFGVDVPSDVEKIEKIITGNSAQRELYQKILNA